MVYCITHPNEAAVVKFYFATNNSKTPSELLTVLAGELLLRTFIGVDRC